MPGGATVKCPEFYVMNAFFMQATEGDNTTERPMWAERGGLDFDGKNAWDQWVLLKGTSKEDARSLFVAFYREMDHAKALYSDTRKL